MSKLPPPPPPPPLPSEEGSLREQRLRELEAGDLGSPRSPIAGGTWRPTKDAEIDLRAVDPRRRAKLVGMLAYVRAGGLSVRQVWQQTPLDSLEPDGLLLCDVVDYEQFHGWSKYGRWRDERDKLWGEIEQRALRAVAGQAVQQEIAEVQKLEDLRKQAEVQLGLAEPKSFEGMVRALLAVDRRISEKRGAIADSVAAKVTSGERAVEFAEPGAGAVGVVPYDDQLTEKDIVAMAKAVVAHRVRGESDDD